MSNTSPGAVAINLWNRAGREAEGLPWMAQGPVESEQWEAFSFLARASSLAQNAQRLPALGTAPREPTLQIRGPSGQAFAFCLLQVFCRPLPRII